MAIYFMNFSDDDKFLMIFFQQVDNYRIRQHNGNFGHYVIWDLKQGNDYGYNLNVKFEVCKFPNHIYGVRRAFTDNFNFK